MRRINLELLFVTVVGLFVMFMILSQKWYSAYLRERGEVKKYQNIYVKNLQEIEEFRLNQQSFISFIRALFLLSLTGSFIKQVFREYLIKIKLTKRQALTEGVYSTIKKY
jgi:uncharacterized membrane protein